MKKKIKSELDKRPPNEKEIKKARKFARSVSKLALDLFDAKVKKDDGEKKNED